ncbi:unnamed protein product [Brachionus calyciflorus]|uniref:Uncharacterized protein n=1 Tax=Brachionus calyciflorus TaxID=104777 RepID=A0A814BJE8_9BILA|nr:unnamed protein product [Brachionus calyciflorus]
MFETKSELVEFHEKLICKNDKDSSLLNSYREIIISKLKELERLNLENFDTKNYKHCVLIENPNKSLFSNFPVFLIISKLLMPQKFAECLEYTKLYETKKFDFKEKAILDIVCQLIREHDENLIIDLSERNVLDEIKLDIQDSESDLSFMPQLLDATKINSIRLHVPECKQIPINCFEHFKNLLNLSIISLKGSLISNNFLHLQKLENLKIHGGLKKIFSNAFVGLKNLKSLEICDINLKYLDDDVFNGLDNLEYLYIDNDLIEFSQALNVFIKDKFHLKARDNFCFATRFRNCRLPTIIRSSSVDLFFLKNIDQDILEKFKNIVCLNLNCHDPFDFGFVDTHVEFTFDYNFSFNNSMTNLLNSRPEFSRFLVFANIVQIFDLVYLELCTVRDLEKIKCKNLTFLIIDKVGKLPKFSPNFRGLKALKLKDISQFDKDCFENLENLEYLHMDARNDSILDEIEANTFKGLNNLKYFKLSLPRQETISSLSDFKSKRHLKIVQSGVELLRDLISQVRLSEIKKEYVRIKFEPDY